MLRMMRMMMMRIIRRRIRVRRIRLRVKMRIVGCPVGGGLTARGRVTPRIKGMILEQVVDRRDRGEVDLLVLAIIILFRMIRLAIRAREGRENLQFISEEGLKLRRSTRDPNISRRKKVFI